MSLVRRMAQHALEAHPDQTATVLERSGDAESLALLGSARLDAAAAVMQRFSPLHAAAMLAGLPAERAAKILEEMSVDAAARLVRRGSPAVREAILAAMPRARAESIARVLRFPEGTAGALMDPDVLALPAEFTAREALQRVRQDADQARYNLYVVDDEQRLTGALNLRELLLAKPSATLGSLMKRDPHRIVALADRASVVAHPGWKVVHSLPVVDESGAFLGAIRYGVLRRLERDLASGRRGDVDSGVALGELLAAAARGVFDAVSGSGIQSAKEARDGEE